MPKMKLSDIGSLSRGKSKHRPRNDKILYGGKYPFVQTSDIKNANHILHTYEQTYNEIGLKQSKLWGKNTICITIAANIADSAILGFDACFPDSIIGLTVNDKIANYHYVEYLLQYYKRIIQNQSNGTSQENINLETFEQVYFDIPSLNEQNNISNTLYSIDKKIDLNNKINSELEDFAKKLYEYWFIQFDFPDENERPYKSSGGMLFFDEKYKTLIPIGWKIQNFNSNDLTEIIQPSIDKFENEKIYLPTANIQNDKIIDFSNKITYTNRESRANMQPISNSVWFAKMKNSKKLLYFSDYSKKYLNSLILSTGLCGLYCKNNSLEYIWNTVNREYFEIKKDSLAHGATQQAINNEDLISIPLLIPHQNIIEQYHNKVKAMYKQKYLNEVENIILTRLRDFLLPMLMNGQITIK